MAPRSGYACHHTTLWGVAAEELQDVIPLAAVDTLDTPAQLACKELTHGCQQHLIHAQTSSVALHAKRLQAAAERLYSPNSGACIGYA